jgi:hypothetical protein
MQTFDPSTSHLTVAKTELILAAMTAAEKRQYPAPEFLLLLFPPWQQAYRVACHGRRFL